MISILGGMGSINGSLIAAAVITYLNIILQNQLSGGLAPIKNIVYALILILIVIFSNAPAMKRFRESLNFKRLFKRKLTEEDAAKISNDEAKWERIETKIKMDEVLSADTRSTYADAPVPPGADVVPLERTKDELYHHVEEGKGEE